MSVKVGVWFPVEKILNHVFSLTQPTEEEDENYVRENE